MLDPARLKSGLIAHGLARADEEIGLEPLGGGVSCDVFRVDLAAGPVCVKQALPKLRVEAEWRVAPERAQVEAAWLQLAEDLRLSAPRLLYEDRDAHFFVMNYCPNAEPWKSRLARGETEPDFARAVGELLARMHAETRGDQAVRERFANAELFEALRIDPFLLHCARVHPSHAARLEAIAEATRAQAATLIHGDFSPKNILCAAQGPAVLDAECATWGDPAFDLAFCLTHLLLKSRWRDDACDAVLGDARAFASAYFDRAPKDRAGVEYRAVRLIGALLLARVDGKSPVEYLDGSDRAFVRETAIAWLDRPPDDLEALFQMWRERMDRQ